MASEIQFAEGELLEAAPVRPVPVQGGGALQVWGREVGPVALAAAGGAAAGIAAVAAAHAAHTARTRGVSRRRAPRRGAIWRRRERVVGSRSFLVDVHILGR